MPEISNDIRRELARCAIGFEQMAAESVGEADEKESGT
jgi:hypothetical protein